MNPGEPGTPRLDMNVAVAVHAVARGAVVRLLGGGTGRVPSGGNAAGVTDVPWK